MKRILKILSLSVFLSFVFSSCDGMLPVEEPEDNGPVVTGTKLFELTDPVTDISDKVKETSKVWVVQVNTGDVLDPGDIESSLKESEPVSENLNLRFADDEIDLPVINHIPDFVRNYKKYLKPRAEVLNTKSLNSEKKLPAFPSFRGVDDDSEPVDTFSFFLTLSADDDDFNDYVDVPLVYSSKYADIYYFPNISWLEDENYGENFLTEIDFEAIGTKFDQIYEAETKLAGSRNMMPSENENAFSYLSFTPEKVSIVLYDIFSDSEPETNSGTFGFFSPDDMFENAYPSSETHAIYLDSVLYKNETNTSISTLAHELNHLLNFVNKEVNAGVEEETWFSEMLSVVSEDVLFEKYIKDDDFLETTVRPDRMPFFNGSYNSGINYTAENQKENFSLEHYGFVFAYGSFLIRNYGGIDLLHKIATNSKTNEDAITQALADCKIKSSSGTGYASFEETLLAFATSSLNYKSSEEVPSLNKTLSGSVGNFSFKAPGINPEDFNQAYFNPSKEKYVQSRITGIKVFDETTTAGLGTYGFLIQYAGEGTESLNVKLPEYDNLHMYCFIQDYE